MMISIMIKHKTKCHHDDFHNDKAKYGGCVCVYVCVCVHVCALSHTATQDKERYSRGLSIKIMFFFLTFF